MKARELSKLNRVTAWILAVVVIIYLVTGLAMTGKFSADKLVRVRTADRLHLSDYLLYLLIITLAVHGGFCLYLRLKALKLFK